MRVTICSEINAPGFDVSDIHGGRGSAQAHDVDSQVDDTHGYGSVNKDRARGQDWAAQ